MAVSRDSDHGRRTGFPKETRPTRYDLVLTAIPLILTIALVAAALLEVPFEIAVAAGGGLNLVIVVDALFLNPPTHGGVGGD